MRPEIYASWSVEGTSSILVSFVMKMRLEKKGLNQFGNLLVRWKSARCSAGILAGLGRPED